MNEPTIQDELKEQLSSILFDDDFPILSKKDNERLDELTKLINNQVLEELDRIYQNSSYAEDRTAKEVLDRIESRLNQLRTIK